MSRGAICSDACGIRSEFGNKLKGKDEIIEKLVSLLKRDDNCSGK